jgi:hypothetical protein
MNEQNRKPSAEAWAAIRGAIDLHVHVGPDVIQRRIDDIDLAQEFRVNGLAGFVLKSHYVPTAERATAVRRAVPGIQALGALALNHAVGGLNPAALEVSARLGACVVWMPTVDAANEWTNRPSGAPPPAWGAFHEQLRQRPTYPSPISLLNPDGQLNEAVNSCLEVISAYDMVLATGHIGREEILALVPRARELGVSKIVVTHVEFPSLALTAEEQIELARQGAIIEHCYTTAYTGKTSWETMFANIRATGPEVVIISTDLGQVGNPPVAVGLADFADRLLKAGFSPDEVRRMTVDNPGQLVSSVTSRVTTSSRDQGG